MRRLVALVAFVAVAGLTGCSGASDSTPLPPDRAGNPTDTLSPDGPSPSLTPTPPPAAGAGTPAARPVTGQAARSGTVAPATPLDLPACMIGTWTAPVAREFGNLGIRRRTGGTVRDASGLLSVAFTADHRWIFTYRQVQLRLAAGSVDVSGPMDGTWSLGGNVLTSTLSTTTVKATMHLGGLSVGVPGQVSTLVRTLQPDQVFVTCTGSSLQFQLPVAQGGGIATFDQT
jgi:hypothetical protein